MSTLYPTQASAVSGRSRSVRRDDGVPNALLAISKDLACKVGNPVMHVARGAADRPVAHIRGARSCSAA
jgi:hypothetical protein